MLRRRMGPTDPWLSHPVTSRKALRPTPVVSSPKKRIPSPPQCISSSEFKYMHIGRRHTVPHCDDAPSRMIRPPPSVKGGVKGRARRGELSGCELPDRQPRHLFRNREAKDPSESAQRVQTSRALGMWGSAGVAVRAAWWR